MRRTSKILPHTAERTAQINAARRRRIASGSMEQHKKYDFHSRVVGFSNLV
jgi:hypothetical protein